MYVEEGDVCACPPRDVSVIQLSSFNVSSGPPHPHQQRIVIIGRFTILSQSFAHKQESIEEAAKSQCFIDNVAVACPRL